MSPERGTREIIVRVADLSVGTAGDVLTTVGLGSCVAIALHDPVARIAGLAHILLPSPALSREADKAGKFPQTALPMLLARMVEEGAARRRITARLAGGASMFANLTPPGAIQMGERNVVACRQALADHEVPLVGEAVGGDFGRTVRLHVESGRLDVSSILHGVQTL
ncbi:MAG TPA: chemotaxis protein CheD [Gemmatimonadales bacterium]|nr:chemotaxis protein CheD [Gemmatimonadales bacterium]